MTMVGLHEFIRVFCGYLLVRGPECSRRGRARTRRAHINNPHLLQWPQSQKQVPHLLQPCLRGYCPPLLVHFPQHHLTLLLLWLFTHPILLSKQLRIFLFPLFEYDPFKSRCLKRIKIMIQKFILKNVIIGFLRNLTPSFLIQTQKVSKLVLPNLKILFQA